MTTNSVSCELIDNWSALFRVVRVYNFKVDISPQAKQSVRMTRSGRAYVDPIKKKYIEDITAQLSKQYLGNKIAGLVKVTCVYSFPWTNATRMFQSSGFVLKPDDPDLDNLFKPFADSLKSVCLQDDKQIVCMEALKVRSDFIGITARLQEVVIDRAKIRLNTISEKLR